ncbi:MAG: aminomethyltransferase family protein [Acidobacteriota bacterium]|nr:aminomethyltransferase family protein [Blastocatellia bacterium]MDW8167160.1 aminomethyltransferase family protein [Acidobacteriota bacterium]MDW8256485.1 aminomethyltransferase family protein [Acidobacteriota bacterium]
MRTPFYEWEAAFGARFEEEGGWIVPFEYSSVEEEHRAIREAVGLLDLSGRGRILVRGRESARFLQSMLSNDIAHLPAGRGVPATLLTNKGRMIGLMRVYNLGSEYLLDVEPRAAEKTLRTLQEYKMALRVEIEEVTDSLVALSLQGPKARELLSTVLGGDLALGCDGEITLYSIEKVIAQEGGEIDPAARPSVWIARASHTGEEGYDVFMERAVGPVMWRAFWRVGEGFGLRAVGFRALFVLRLEAGIPWYGYDVDETTIPLEAGLESAISFTKGCYIGQETIAMIRYRGHINRKLVGLRCRGDRIPNPGDRIVEGDTEVGRITSAAFSFSLRAPIALGYVKCAWAEPGTRLRVKAKDADVEAEVHPLPFISKSEEQARA